MRAGPCSSSVHVVAWDEAVQALECAVEHFDLRAFVVAVDDSHRSVVVDLLAGESFAKSSDHPADSALLFQIVQFGERILVGIDGDGAFAVVRDQLMTASRDRNRSCNRKCADDERRNSHRKSSSTASATAPAASSHGQDL